MVQSGPVQDGIAGEDLEAAFRQIKSDVSRILKVRCSRYNHLEKRRFFF
jgi:hypothetical protein